MEVAISKIPLGRAILEAKTCVSGLSEGRGPLVTNDLCNEPGFATKRSSWIELLSNQTIHEHLSKVSRKGKQAVPVERLQSNLGVIQPRESKESEIYRLENDSNVAWCLLWVPLIFFQSRSVLQLFIVANIKIFFIVKSFIFIFKTNTAIIFIQSIDMRQQLREGWCEMPGMMKQISPCMNMTSVNFIFIKGPWKNIYHSFPH